MEGYEVKSFGLEGDPGSGLAGVAGQVLFQPGDGGHAFRLIARGDDEAQGLRGRARCDKLVDEAAADGEAEPAKGGINGEGMVASIRFGAGSHLLAPVTSS